jgi:hypothetical protein
MFKACSCGRGFGARDDARRRRRAEAADVAIEEAANRRAQLARDRSTLERAYRIPRFPSLRVSAPSDHPALARRESVVPGRSLIVARGCKGRSAAAPLFALAAACDGEP